MAAGGDRGLLAIAFFLLGLISDLLIPLIFAAILAAIFVPLVDRLERWRLPRWLGAPLGVGIEPQDVRDDGEQRRRVQTEVGGALGLWQHLAFQEAMQQPVQFPSDPLGHRHVVEELDHLGDQGLNVHGRGLRARGHARTIPDLPTR
jgi:MFS family permease